LEQIRFGRSFALEKTYALSSQARGSVRLAPLGQIASPSPASLHPDNLQLVIAEPGNKQFPGREFDSGRLAYHLFVGRGPESEAMVRHAMPMHSIALTT